MTLLKHWRLLALGIVLAPFHASAEVNPLRCLQNQSYQSVCRALGPLDRCSEELSELCCDCQGVWDEEFTYCVFNQDLNPPPGSSSSSSSSSSSGSSSSNPGGTCQDGEECIWEELDPSACAEVNGFLGHINIATVINVSENPLHVNVSYRDLFGVIRGRVQAQIAALRRQDFIVNDLGLQPDTYGTVCVATDAGTPGKWTGRVTIYKSNIRQGNPATFGGSGFDYALDFPFTNKRSGTYTVPLNTFHLGLQPDATVANWIQLTDAAQDDGRGLKGELVFFDAEGGVIQRQPVNLPDGGRFDYSAHDALTGGVPRDLVGMARFIPDDSRGTQQFYLTAARYMYDCSRHSCNNFRTAFTVPSRPPTHEAVHGGVSTTNGEIRIVEVNNFADHAGQAQVSFASASGEPLGTTEIPIPARGTRHVIVNQSGNSGYLAGDALGCSQVECEAGMLASMAFGYKLDKDGQLLYGYAVPLVARSPGARQVAEFNSFLEQKNEVELVSTLDSPVTVGLEARRYYGAPIVLPSITVPPRGVSRLPLNLLFDEYGLVIVTPMLNGQPTTGVIARSYVTRTDEYVLSYPGR